jgi:hypothetical protein
MCLGCPKDFPFTFRDDVGAGEIAVCLKFGSFLCLGLAVGFLSPRCGMADVCRHSSPLSSSSAQSWVLLTFLIKLPVSLPVLKLVYGVPEWPPRHRGVAYFVCVESTLNCFGLASYNTNTDSCLSS